MPAADPKKRFKFTEATLKALPTPKAGRVRYRDSDCPGLSLYCTNKGEGKGKRLVFYFRSRIAEIPLGESPALTVEEARKKVKTSIAPDPAAAAAKRRAIREESTLAELWAWFDLHHVAHLRESTQRHYRDSWRLHLLPALGAKQLSAIHRRDVQAMADDVTTITGKGAGRHVCAVLSAMYHAAAKDEALQFKGDIPTTGIRRPKVASRARFLQPGELPAFLAALAEEPPLWKLFWTCCLFVGLRRGNVASARWSDVSLDLGQWMVPEERSKNGALLAVPIPLPVLAQLKAWREEQPAQLKEANNARRRLLERGDAGSRERQPLLTTDELTEAERYVFPSALALGKPSGQPHITDPKASWRRVLIRAGLSDLRPHDLRRSIGSWMALGGVGLPIIGAALGHKDQRSTAVYARLNDGAVRAAMERATSAMLTAGHSQTKEIHREP